MRIVRLLRRGWFARAALLFPLITLVGQAIVISPALSEEDPIIPPYKVALLECAAEPAGCRTYAFFHSQPDVIYYGDDLDGPLPGLDFAGDDVDAGMSGPSTDSGMSAPSDDPAGSSLDNKGVGFVVDALRWRYNDLIEYGVVIPTDGRLEVVGTISVTAEIVLNGRWVNPFRMESVVRSGPPILMTYKFDCREDRIIDSSCSGGTKTRSNTDFTSGIYREDYLDTRHADSAGNTNDGKFFWNFNFGWKTEGGHNLLYSFGKQTSKRYTCDGSWEPEVDGSGYPCAFNVLANVGGQALGSGTHTLVSVTSSAPAIEPITQTADSDGKAEYTIIAPLHPDMVSTLRMDYGDGSYEFASIPQGSGTYTIDVSHSFFATGTYRQGATIVETGNSATSTTQVVNASATSAISAGGRHSLALRNDGTVWAWGLGYAQVPRTWVPPTWTPSSSTPVQVSGLSGVTAISAGGGHSLALKPDGTVWAWGENGSGQLGNGTNRGSWTLPAQVSGLTGVTAISAGGSHSFALKTDGTVWAWGEAQYGQLGTGITASDSWIPVQVSGLSTVTAIAAGSEHSLALKADGTAWAFGWNLFGQLGNGTTSDSSTPVQVSGLNGATGIAAGGHHSVALKGDGHVWAWGENGMLGDGTDEDSSTPVEVLVLNDITQIAAGYGHSLALKGDGTEWAWGSNWEGQLGNGTTSYSPVPTEVGGPSGLAGVTALAGGGLHSLSLNGNGTVWAWGYNWEGQLGNGGTVSSPTPLLVAGIAI